MDNIFNGELLSEYFYTVELVLFSSQESEYFLYQLCKTSTRTEELQEHCCINKVEILW